MSVENSGHKTTGAPRRSLLRQLLPGRLLLAGCLLLAVGRTQAAFNPGSTGADGALDLSTVSSGTTVLLDPPNMVPPRDVDGDNVFNFTTINIPAGRTLKLRATELHWAPVELLATGAVTIDGTIDLTGGNGTYYPEGTLPGFSVPGPGGFPGGYGGQSQVTAIGGWGPGGGSPGNWASGGSFSSNVYLLPLIGGGGGGGAYYHGSLSTSPGGSGGGGGGAILIASPSTITVNGKILCVGGLGGISQVPVVYGTGGSGGGGAIRLMAPTIAGSGQLSTAGGGLPFNGNQGAAGGSGRIRLEANTHSYTGTFIGEVRRLNLSPNANTGAGQAPRVRVTHINGVAVAANPTGSVAVPDSVINTGAPVNFTIQGKNIPVGKTVTMYLYNETLQLSSQPAKTLTGTDTQSTATVITTIPTGYNRVWLTSSW